MTELKTSLSSLGGQWRNIIVRPIVSLKGNHLVMKSRLLPSRLQRCDEAKQPCSLCKDVVGQQA